MRYYNPRQKSLGHQEKTRVKLDICDKGMSCVSLFLCLTFGQDYRYLLKGALSRIFSICEQPKYIFVSEETYK